MKVLFTSLLFLSLSAHAHSGKMHTFAPENDLLRPLTFSQQGISEQTYNDILDRIEEVYGPMYASKNLQLEINRDWSSPQVNAGAFPVPMSGKALLWFPGGLPRHEAMTAEAFTVVACHEVGHQLGGMPHSGLSFEGQADYFATLKCMRFVLEGLDNLAVLDEREVSPVAQQKCQESFTNDEDILICVRSSMAGVDAAMVLKTLHKEGDSPKLSTPDMDVVEQTNSSYPSTQCRLDTYFSGALCPVNKSVAVSNSNADDGACSRARGDLVGIRPLCWYKPEAQNLILTLARN